MEKIGSASSWQEAVDMARPLIESESVQWAATISLSEFSANRWAAVPAAMFLELPVGMLEAMYPAVDFRIFRKSIAVQGTTHWSVVILYLKEGETLAS